MSTSFVLKAGGQLLALLVLGQLSVWATTANSAFPAPRPTRQYCSVSVEGDRAFVTCRFSVDVGAKKEKFHLMYKNDRSNRAVNETSNLHPEYALAFACFWHFNGTLSCAGDDGYRLGSPSITDTLVIEVPRRGAEDKKYLCQLAGNTDPDSAQACCFTSARKQDDDTPAASASLGQSEIIIILSIFFGLTALALIGIVILCIIRRCRKRLRQGEPRRDGQPNDVDESTQSLSLTRGINVNDITSV